MRAPTPAVCLSMCCSNAAMLAPSVSRKSAGMSYSMKRALSGCAAFKNARAVASSAWSEIRAPVNLKLPLTSG